MKPVASYTLSALAIALPLACVVLLPCEEQQDETSYATTNTSNTTLPSNATAPSPSSSSICLLSPPRIWNALASLFSSGTPPPSPTCTTNYCPPLPTSTRH